MDPITHAASGALLAYALPKEYRPESKFFAFFAALMAASPDIDIVFATTPINYLLLHRGITHSLAAVPIMAVLLAVLAAPLWLKKGKRMFSFYKATEYIPRKPWTFGKTVLLAAVCVLLHIWLDIVTTYGTMIFLPFSEYRVRLNGLFIIDILLTGTMLLTVWHGSKFRPYALMGLTWVFLYPAICVGIVNYHEYSLRAALQEQNMVQERGVLEGVTVYPDAFAPLYWRAVYQTQKPYTRQDVNAFTWAQAKSRVGFEFASSPATVYQQGFTLWGTWRTPLMQYPALRPDLAQSLAQQSRRARAFLAFSVFPIQERKAHLTQQADGVEWGVYDLRFSTMLKSLQEFLAVRNEGNPTFLLEARGQENQWNSVRLLFPGAGLDSHWQKPVPSEPVTWYQRLVGIEY